jgi:hypothetical protein
MPVLHFVGCMGWWCLNLGKRMVCQEEVGVAWVAGRICKGLVQGLLDFGHITIGTHPHASGFMCLFEDKSQPEGVGKRCAAIRWEESDQQQRHP